jgi:hypothetical protein
MSNCFNDIRDIIQFGYIEQSFKINDIFIKLKNPNLQTIDWANQFSPSTSIEKNLAILSKCITSIAGRDTENLHFEIYDMLINSQIFSILHKIGVYADLLMSRAIKSNKYLEAFCYTEESRYLWKAWKARSLFSNHKLNDLNNIQISWVIWNEAEDERFESDKEWEKAFFIASATNPKGVEAVQKKWKMREQTEETRRLEIVEDAKKGILENTENKPKKTHIKKSKTTEDLRDEMRRWVMGEEDEHDISVREYKEEIQRSVDEMVRRSEEIRKRNRKKRDELDQAIKGISLIGLTEEDVKNKYKKEPNAYDVQDVNKQVIDSFIMTPVDKGNLSVNDGEVVGKQPESLMDRISHRRPTME